MLHQLSRSQLQFLHITPLLLLPVLLLPARTSTNSSTTVFSRKLSRWPVEFGTSAAGREVVVRNVFMWVFYETCRFKNK